MKDIDQIRRENMIRLETECGSVRVAAEKAAMSQAQWSNLRAGAADSKTGKPRGMRKETARKIEDAHGKPIGWLDIDHLSLSSNTNELKKSAEFSPVDQWGEKPMQLASVSRLKTRSDYVTIYQYADIAGSMGNGLTLPDQPGTIEKWSVSREWMEKNVGPNTGVSNLCIVTGFGPSMQPEYNPGDPLLVDTGVKSVIADGIYFFRIGDEGFIKQLQKIPTEDGIKYIAKSKNPDYDPFEITSRMDFEVLGKVIRVWRGTNF